MTLDEMKQEALQRVEATFPEGSHFRINKVYENFIDGTLISVLFDAAPDKQETAHIHFGRDETRFYRWHSDVLNAVASHKERNAFFRLLNLAGVGGVIALFLVVVFSLLLGVLALTNQSSDTSVVEVIKHSFSLILGFFFGSQTGHKKS